MSTKHTATLPDGTIAKRTSATRVYPFVIARGPLTVEHQIEDIRAGIARGVERIGYLRSVVDYLTNGGEIIEGRGPYPFESARPVHATGLPNNGHDERRDAWRGLGLMGNEFQGMDLDEFRAKMIARFTEYADSEERRNAESEARIPTLKVGAWAAAAWSSRADLAGKTAESTRRLDPRREVLVLETERV